MSIRPAVLSYWTLFTGALCVLAASFFPLNAQSVFVANGTYEIISGSSNLALAANGTTDGSAVVQQTYSATATQQWTVTNLGNNVVELVLPGTSEALGTPQTAAGANLTVSTYTGSTSQQWTLVAVTSGIYELVNVASGYAANVSGNSTSSGATICQWNANASSNERWTFTLTGGSGPPPTTYALTVNSGTGTGSYAAGTVVSVSANAAPAGSQFAAWTGNTGALASSTSATTTLTMPAAPTSITATYTTTNSGSGSPFVNGTYELVSNSSNLALAANGTTDGSAVVQQTYTGAATQQWTVTNLSNNVIELVLLGTAEALGTPQAADGTNLTVASYTGSASQQWTVVTIGGGYYELVNVATGYAVNVGGNSTSPGATICQWNANASTNERWSFTATSGTAPPPVTYALTVTNGTGGGSYTAGTVVTVSANTAPAGSQFAAWTGNTAALANTTAATTTLTMPAAATSITATYTPVNSGSGSPFANGTFEIVSNSSSLALAAKGTTDGSAVVQQTYSGAATQQWTVTNLGNSVIEIALTGTSEALGTPQSSAGTNLTVSTYVGSTSQQWTVVTTSSGAYELVNVGSGYAMNVSGASTMSGATICQWYANGSPNSLWSFTALSSSAPGGGSIFGVACDATQTPNAATWMPPIAQTGLSWVRMSAAWNQLQPTQGAFVYAPMDSIVSSAAANNLQVSAILAYSTSWISSNQGTFPLSNLSAWSTYAGTVVGHYAGKITYWEIWNEPENFSNGGTPANYASIVVPAYNAAKAANPNAQLGISFAEVDVNWMKQAINAGAADHFDYIALHPYSTIDAMSQGWEGDYLNIVKTVRTMLAANDPAKANVPIWFTELGDEIGFNGATETDQANNLVKGYSMGLAEGVTRIDWFEAQDGDSGPMGLLDSSGNERMGYHAMKSMITNLGSQPTYQGWLLLNGQDYGFVFNSGAMAAWAPPGVSDSVTFSANVQVVNPLTEAVTSLPAGQVLTLTNTPVLVLGIPSSLLATAQANKSLPFPWKGNYSGATSVNIQMGNPNVESGLHQMNTSLYTPALVNGTWVQDVSTAAGQSYEVDPNFLDYTPSNLQVTATVMAKNSSAGFNFQYESVNGFEGIGWNSIPNDGQWHTFTFNVTDDEFVGLWGYNFTLNSDKSSQAGYYVKSVTATLTH